MTAPVRATRATYDRAAPDRATPGRATRDRAAPGPRCGWPGRCAAPDAWHTPPKGTRRVWTYHDIACPRRADDPALYPECGLIADHCGPCAFTRRPGRALAAARRRTT
jgi:hypothetical protein